MPRIRILDDVVANKIAAGEVVERPASVVKELVENSLDAGATRIEVEVEDGGRRLIRVTDNGCGMDEEDAILSLQRHATSKIATAEDLYRIQTLGFRGEALPSIAAVSELLLRTRTPEAEVGVEIRVEGGKVVDFRRVGCPPGTTVEVRRLFFNTPARLKFLKSAGTEMGHIADRIARFALLYHSVSFRLLHDGQEVFHSPASEEMLHAIAAVYGREVAREMVPLDLETPILRIRGYISKPLVSRSSRNYQTYFVNGRFVQSRTLTHALYEGYHTLLMVNRHPIAVVVLEIDPSLVDVNVHPAKAEVRFTREWEVHELLKRAVETALERAHLLPAASLQGAAATAPSQPPSSSLPLIEALQRRRQEAVPTRPSEPLGTYVELGEDFLPRRMTPLGQILNSYILAESEEGLLIIDQHAAHERVLYEQFMAREAHEPVKRQALVVPATLHLSPQEARTVEEHRETLKELGFLLEPFGRDTYLLRSVPLAIASLPYERILRDIIEELALTAATRGFAPHRDEVLGMMACKSAIKAGDPLSPQEIERLLEQLRQARRPYTCRHGRPTIICITRAELERKFKRR